MAAFFRFGSRNILNQILKNQNLGMISLVRPAVTLKPSPNCPGKPMTHDERNMKLGRPQSPHLSIYAAQLTSLLSISHRATGMILAGYTILFSAAGVLLPEDIDCYLQTLEESDISNTILQAAKFMLAFPICYHFWNGIRNLFWDFGMFLNLSDVYVTGYAMLLLAFGSAAALTVM